MSASDRGFVRRQIADLKRELAILDAAEWGAAACRGPRNSSFSGSVGDFERLFCSSASLYMLLDPRPGLRIVDMNAPYAAATLTDRTRTPGERLFDVFPDNPELPDANGVTNLFSSLRIAADSGRPHAMAVQRYDVRGDDGRFVQKYWRPSNRPIFDDQGRLRWLLHEARDVTAHFADIRPRHRALA